MVARDATDGLPLWLLIVTVVVMVVRIAVVLHEKFYPPQIPELIKWSTYDDVKKRFFEINKPAAMFFVHEGKCLQCSQFETTLQQPDIAEQLQKSYVPIRVTIPRATSKSKLPKELARLKDNYGIWSVPKLALITTEMWDVPLNSDYWYIPRTSSELFLARDDSKSIRKLLKESIDWHAPVLTYGEVKWVKPDVALAQATDQKPALLFFGRSLDRHSDYVRSKIFGDTDLNKTINEDFLPAFVVSLERKNRPDSEQTKALLKRFRIKSFPSIIVSSPSRPAQLLTGYPGSVETMEFLKQTLEK